jgi:hypothetical protein
VGRAPLQLSCTLAFPQHTQTHLKNLICGVWIGCVGSQQHEIIHHMLCRSYEPSCTHHMFECCNVTAHASCTHTLLECSLA